MSLNANVNKLSHAYKEHVQCNKQLEAAHPKTGNALQDTAANLQQRKRNHCNNAKKHKRCYAHLNLCCTLVLITEK